jgi:hypothetical protein
MRVERLRLAVSGAVDPGPADICGFIREMLLILSPSAHRLLLEDANYGYRSSFVNEFFVPELVEVLSGVVAGYPL